jgi:putative ABC transport system permease protein
MRYWELLRLALGGVRRTPLRVILTALGVTIATGSLVCMVAFALGVQARVEEPFQKSELLNRIEVTPKGSFRGFGPQPPDATSSSSESDAILDDAALSRIQNLAGVALAYPELRLSGIEVRYGEKTEKTSAAGLPVEASRLPFVQDALVAGAFFGSSGEGQAIIGTRLAKNLGFETPADALGCSLSLQVKGLAPGEGKTFKFDERKMEVQVVGVWTPPAGRPGFSADGILLPQSVIKEMPGVQFDSAFQWLRRGKPGMPPTYERLVVRVKGPSDLFVVEKQIQEMGFHTETLLARIKQIREAFLIMDLVLTSVGTVALVVAGLGIINTLLMAVLERYREIGTYKALGASDGDVRMIFLAEAGVVGLAGGLGGLVLGRVVAWIIEVVVNGIARSRGFDEPIMAFAFPLYLLGGAVLFAIAVSLVSGVYPAMRAARIDPIQALRGE